MPTKLATLLLAATAGPIADSGRPPFEECYLERGPKPLPKKTRKAHRTTAQKAKRAQKMRKTKKGNR